MWLIVIDRPGEFGRTEVIKRNTENEANATWIDKKDLVELSEGQTMYLCEVKKYVAMKEVEL